MALVTCEFYDLSPKPLSDCRYEGDGGDKVDGKTVTARYDATPVLEPSKHALDDVAAAVRFTVERTDDVARDDFAVGAGAEITGDDIAARLDQPAFLYPAQQVADKFRLQHRPRMVSKPGGLESSVVGTAATFNPCACMGRTAALLPTCPCTTWLWIGMMEVVMGIDRDFTSRPPRSWTGRYARDAADDR
ncbi:hypothetical protein CHELA1G11_20728 [Hyphomicrobiales bacterium]|nr:hypothetical protein CHELA1G11_20728 [Hyphomicrobiales bacterium]CAH1691639.1 hypothetical protein CHELA1G2_21043 [Hyphomicrobiales bacterium]